MKQNTKNLEIGNLGEGIAVEYLRSKGYTILARNWRNKHGELDVVARKDSFVVAVEVKTRSSLNFGAPLEAITSTKVVRLRRLLAAWAAEHSACGVLLRIDGVGVTLQGDGSPLIEHVEGII